MTFNQRPPGIFGLNHIVVFQIEVIFKIGFKFSALAARIELTVDDRISVIARSLVSGSGHDLLSLVVKGPIGTLIS